MATTNLLRNVFFTLLFSTAAFAVPVIDQQQLTSSGHIGLGAPPFALPGSVTQSFTAGLTGKLTQLDLALYSPYASEAAVIGSLSVNDSASGQSIGSGSLYLAHLDQDYTWTSIFLNEDVNLMAAHVYNFTFTSGFTFAGSINLATNDAGSLTYRTWVDGGKPDCDPVTATPEPASMALCSGGILMAGLFLRRKKAIA